MAKQSSASGLEDHLGYWLRFVSNHVSHAFTLKVEAKGVTVAEWVLMRELFRIGSCNPSQLADALGMTRGTISKLVERLCQKEFVERSSRSDDRRFQSVALTAAGKKLVPVLARLADDNDREFFGHLDAEQQSHLKDQLQDLVRRHEWKDVPLS